MNIVFCADHKVKQGLHVAAYSILDRITTTPSFHIFSDALTKADIETLHRTLKGLDKPFQLQLYKINLEEFKDFPTLNGSWATYYRLYAASNINATRFLYVDVDILCDIDVSPLNKIEMEDAALGWVPEAPLNLAVDTAVAKELGNSPDQYYFNAGVMLVNVPEWRRQNVSEKAMKYVAQNRPLFHDQSALNVILFNKTLKLDSIYNCISNSRKNWKQMTKAYGEIGMLIHFVDYPKPWDYLAEWVHPQAYLWREILDNTAMKNYRSWHKNSLRSFPRNKKSLYGYKKLIKDRMLFWSLKKGIIAKVKGA